MPPPRHIPKLASRNASQRRIAEITARAMEEHWGGVDPSRLTVRDTSGCGGGKVYLVSNKRAGMPYPKVALHARKDRQSSSGERRMYAAALAMQEAGLAPERICYGEDWFIEAYGGEVVDCRANKIETIRSIGRLLARVHKVPTGWDTHATPRPNVSLSAVGGRIVTQH